MQFFKSYLSNTENSNHSHPQIENILSLTEIWLTE